MKDLFDAGLRGWLPLFIQGFLHNRQFQVRLGSHMSDSFDQEMGVPQGSILSVILFALKINSIVKNLSPGVECSLYVDLMTLSSVTVLSLFILSNDTFSALYTDYKNGQT